MTADAEVTVRVTRVTEDRAYTVLLAMRRGLLPSKRLPVGRGADQATPPERVWTAGFVAGLESFEALAEAGQSVPLPARAAPTRCREQRIGLTNDLSQRLGALRSALLAAYTVQHGAPAEGTDPVPIGRLQEAIVDTGLRSLREDWAGVRGPAPRGRR
ncbi:MAG: hypothetical protein JXB32_14485 [Deltaproteobacteria bacterium]|nr:hypothetical protein [Deltaproteobacteria bacterium]